MRLNRWCLAGSLALCLGLSALIAFRHKELPPAEEPTGRPRLAVLVFFDQFRGDYLSRWDELFGDDGFHRLEREGTWFQNCNYPYSDTVTAAGHASVVTGCSPDRHGIIENDWFDRGTSVMVNCVGTDRYEPVPPLPRTIPVKATRKEDAKTGDSKAEKYQAASPERLLAPTLADALQKATNGKARVVALSLKDRAAVLPGGRRPDACYWFDSARGLFVTSTYYRDRPHSWVDAFNRARVSDQWLGKPWNRLRDDLDYERFSGPDDVAGEGKGYFQGRTFPHAMNGGPLRLKGLYYGALLNSPFGNELLLDLVRRAVDGEKLGSRDVPDLLCVSFSSNDIVGHCWGPDSQEVLDITLRTDRLVKELLACLDAAVGKGRYVVALTADHGVCPLPEVARDRGKHAARLSPSLLRSRADDYLDKNFPAKKKDRGRWIEATAGPWVYLNQRRIRARGLEQPEVEKALAGWLRKQKGVQTVYTRTQLLAGVPEDDVVGQRVRRSFYPERSGDVMVVVEPYHLITSQLTGTTHGTSHAYDTHVPLLVSGLGIRPGVRKDAVTPQAASVILAHALGIDPPARATVSLPEGLFTPTR